MKHSRFLTIIVTLFLCTAGAIANEPDSAYIFSYTTNANNNHNGLHFAWSTDGLNWNLIGPEYSYIKCDYGRWGSEKRMYEPVLTKQNNGTWLCSWRLNATDGYGHAASPDLVYWGAQTYNHTKPQEAVSIQPYTEAATAYCQLYNEGRYISHAGTYKVEWATVQNLIEAKEKADYWGTLHAEKSKDDYIRFANLKPVDARINVQVQNSKQISDKLIGIFFEDINYAADGGLYAELVQNRDFEYAPADKENHDKTWNARKAWAGKFEIATENPIHANNAHYAIVAPNDTLTNEGWSGIVLRKGDKYDFSLFALNKDGKSTKATIKLTDENNTVLGQTTIKISGNKWKKYEAVITATGETAKAQLQIIPQADGQTAMDMISLFPQKTFHNRKNGLRADIAQVLADMKPQFVRFPGGCVAHGDGLDNIYRWKNSIGKLEERTPMRNLWGYHQTLGLGYYEYFLFCEDIGAEPLPVLAAGVPCQNSGSDACCGGGQQGGIPMNEMDSYIQDILDLIEWANGDAKTTKWGKIRAQSGHPAPFNLKYVGIGNEDLITDIFKERFTMIFKAVKEKYPEIKIVGTVGPNYFGTDYVEGWNIASELQVPIVDEHYYQVPGWFIYHQDYYDRYDRQKPHVYLGEYASHLPGRPSNMETALSEALYLTAIERNGDVVELTSYAPLLAKEKHTQWNPDLIYFNNTEVKPTVGYQVQKLYGNNSGNEYIGNNMFIANNNPKVKARIARSVIRDDKTGDIIVKLVNMLPTTVNTNINFDGLETQGLTAVKTVLAGEPTDKDTMPVTTEITLSDKVNYEMPPYSFTILRIHTAK